MPIGIPEKELAANGEFENRVTEELVSLIVGTGLCNRSADSRNNVVDVFDPDSF